MGLLVLLGLILFGLLAILGYLRWKERRFLKKPTKETIDPALRHQLEKEVHDAERRRKKFQDSLKRHGF